MSETGQEQLDFTSIKADAVTDAIMDSVADQFKYHAIPIQIVEQIARFSVKQAMIVTGQGRKD